MSSAARKRGRSRFSSEEDRQLPYVQTPFLDGYPADFRMRDDTNRCMTIHGPVRAFEEFELVKSAYGTAPSWAVLLIMARHFLDNPPVHFEGFMEALDASMEDGVSEEGDGKLSE